LKTTNVVTMKIKLNVVYRSSLLPDMMKNL